MKHHGGSKLGRIMEDVDLVESWRKQTWKHHGGSKLGNIMEEVNLVASWGK